MYFSGFTYYRGTSQMHSRGKFAILVCSEENSESLPRAIFRKVAMAQCGHFMMGRANIGGKWHTVSGRFGNDGLPMDVPQSIYDAATVIPTDALLPYWKEDNTAPLYNWLKQQ